MYGRVCTIIYNLMNHHKVSIPELPPPMSPFLMPSPRHSPSPLQPKSKCSKHTQHHDYKATRLRSALLYFTSKPLVKKTSSLDNSTKPSAISPAPSVAPPHHLKPVKPHRLRTVSLLLPSFTSSKLQKNYSKKTTTIIIQVDRRSSPNLPLHPTLHDITTHQRRFNSRMCLT